MYRYILWKYKTIYQILVPQRINEIYIITRPFLLQNCTHRLKTGYRNAQSRSKVEYRCCRPHSGTASRQLLRILLKHFHTVNTDSTVSNNTAVHWLRLSLFTEDKCFSTLITTSKKIIYKVPSPTININKVITK